MDINLASDIKKHSFSCKLVNSDELLIDVDSASYRSWLTIKVVSATHGNQISQQFWFSQSQPLRVRCHERDGVIEVDVYQDSCCEYGSIFTLSGLSYDAVQKLISIEKLCPHFRLETRFSFQLFSVV